mmetsp:Transcript_62270/g.98318  ORF Transcript_62270/g.98318 Transcript_62270/m.98318 type:complete len:110 (-) Transcript_62270:1021-1350(-)
MATTKTSEAPTTYLRIGYKFRVQAPRTRDILECPLGLFLPHQQWMLQREHQYSSTRHNGAKIVTVNIHTQITHNPMNTPNSLKGFSTEARLAKKDNAVVTVVAKDAFPA